MFVELHTLVIPILVCHIAVSHGNNIPEEGKNKAVLLRIV